MAEIVLFHHEQGLTSGVLAFADDLRAAGHVVHTPDLYDGRTFTEFTEGIGHADEIGFGTLIERGRLAAEDLPADVVYAGLSLGVMPAQMLAQRRPGATGALLLHSCVPLSEFGGTWPRGVPVQIHTMDHDEWGDVDIAHEFVEMVESAELFLYPGDQHLFTDSSLPVYDESAATVLRKRVLEFLATIG
jgi:dienelactone hydrolase